MSESAFVHLRVHSQYSIVDSVVDIEALVSSVKAKGMSAVALSDECNLYGLIKFYKNACAAGIKPIIGTDLWIESEAGIFRLTLLCRTPAGLNHLMALISKAYLEAKRRDGIPILPKTWLSAERLSGLIGLSGGLEGEIAYGLLRNSAELETWMDFYLRQFELDSFYLEISRLGRPEESEYDAKIQALARRFDLPIVATAPVCFLNPDDFEAHEVRVAVGKGEILDGSSNTKLGYFESQFLKTPEALQALFSDIPEALTNTVEIAKRCNVSLNLDQVLLPDFPVPEGQTVHEFMRISSEKGLAERLESMKSRGQTPNEIEYHQRLKVELDVIIKMGFSGYFLIVADFIQWAKSQDIPVGPGRGSGAGSLVAYALKITDLDPIPYDLLFERFLNPERVSMPDFDVDFCMEGRDRVIDYVAQKYGRDSVSQIITFGSMAAKAAIRDVGRVLGFSYGFVDKVAKLVPNELGITLSDALEDPIFREKYDSDEEVKTLIDMALRLEGTVRNVGKHAGGVIIAPGPLWEYCPVFCEEGTTQIVSQFDKDDVEAIGLVKFDFLGLRNLTIIHSALQTINRLGAGNGLSPIRIEDIPLDDEKTFALLKRCQTTAVFQLESRGMKDLIRRLQPDSFEDIVALVALFRPGPLQSGMVDDFIERKHGRSPVVYDHPDLEEILQTTYGIILYQEQVMKIAQVLASYTLGGADLLRRAMGKKKPEEMAKQREIFVEGASARQIPSDVSGKIFDLMEKFAGYGFNKSHSAAYALVSYQTAYLKAHYPEAFMASVLSSDMDNTDKVVIFVEDLLSLGIRLLPPDIHHSEFEFTVANLGEIRFGLGAVKGVGLAALEGIFEERKKGNFSDFFDFCARVNLRKVNRRVIEALIDSGALDALGPSRESMHLTLDAALLSADQNTKNLEKGQSDIFASDQECLNALQFIEPTEVSQAARCFREKQVLGFFLSGHPMESYVEEVRKMGIRSLDSLSPTPRGKTTRAAGLLTHKRLIKTKQGKWMMVLGLEDQTMRREIMVFSESLERYRDKLEENTFLVIEAEISPDDYSKGLRVAAKDIYRLAEARARYARILKIKLNLGQVKIGMVQSVKSLLEPTKGGQVPLLIEYSNEQAKTLLKTQDWVLHLNETTLNHLTDLLGEAGIELGY